MLRKVTKEKNISSCLKKERDQNIAKKYDEETISKALDDILNKGISKKATSKKYRIPRSILQFQLGQKFTKTTLGPRPILYTEEEQILSTEAVTAASSRVSVADIRKWFLNIETYLREENYFEILKYSDRVFNSDETCFMLCPKNKTVLAPKGARNVYEVDNAPAKSNLTVLFTFSAQGEVTPPFVIYPYKRLLASIAASVPDEWGIGTSSNRWMKTELFFEYIANVFHPYLLKKGTQFPIILFVDGHSTHTSYQLSDLCSQLKIILICLYGNSTRILQPADVSAFKPLKSCWKKVWPESPIRKGKKDTERMPFVLTSEKWKKMQLEKIEKKKDEEKQKEERKRKRTEKREENELKKDSNKKILRTKKEI
ncbi:hypothetical protein NQ314_015717 [Rhamnusium bicolor]|uniref:DDE-1 domain-containing protein n=1 Tax=Rhamnusium bicolor TaxID=1586634 RepID=A0AAV8WYL9_9CUCU|nr:hypothetical protein NQ314_015717 [Rhamnusium bicolor]